MLYFKNRETGELLTYREARIQAVELYDFGDNTNIVSFD
jgi:hypothetical protein